jgi:hypothetical protein
MKIHSNIPLATKVILLLSLVLCACGGPEIQETPDSFPLDQPLPTQSEADSQQATFEEAELPEDFPADFPIPDGARVGSSVYLGEGSFQIYLALPGTLEENLAYYREQLPASSWVITSDTASAGSTSLEISGQEYQGELMFIGAETGVGLEVRLFSPEEAQEGPDAPEDLGQSTTLGEEGSGFPKDFPLPASFQQVQVAGILQEKGYQLAFSYQGLPELALADLTMALINGGWTVGDPSLEGNQRAYRVPFENPATGFQGYGLISNDPAVVGVGGQGMTIIAFQSGE